MINSSNNHSNIVGLTDSAFLALIVIISVIIYITGLGFYNDDWFHFGELINSNDQSFKGLMSSLWDHGWSFKRKPIHIIYQVSSYYLFGLNPIGYHLIITGTLIAMSILLYWTLREIGVQRLLSVTISAVYILLPNYSTDRFWWASFGYILTMCFYFLSLYSDLRAIRGSMKTLICWKMLALSGLVLGSLTYEIVIPLFVLNPIAIWIRTKSFKRDSILKLLGLKGLIAYFGSHYLVISLVIFYKAFISIGNNGFSVPDTWDSAVNLAMGSLAPNFGTFLIGLPQAVWWSINNSSLIILVSALILGVLVFIYIYYTTRPKEISLLSEIDSKELLKYLGIGFLIFLLGYFIFFFATNRIVLSSSSFGNRWAIAGTLGVAIIMVAFLSWISILLRNIIPIRYGFSNLVAGLCLSGFLINNTLAQDYVLAWSQEKKILNEILAKIPKMEPKSTLILIGSCPYIGSAMVFARYDLQGALWVKYGDKTLVADVGTRVSIEPNGLNIKTFDHCTKRQLTYLIDR